MTKNDLEELVEELRNIFSWNEETMERVTASLKRERVTELSDFDVLSKKDWKHLKLPLLLRDLLQKYKEYKQLPDEIDSTELSLDQEDKKILEEELVFNLGCMKLLSKTSWKQLSLPIIVKRRLMDRPKPLIEIVKFKKLEIGNAPKIEARLEPLGNDKLLVTLNNKRYECPRVCPHKGADLLYGWIEEGKLVCPKHKWKFSLENGISDNRKCRLDVKEIEW